MGTKKTVKKIIFLILFISASLYMLNYYREIIKTIWYVTSILMVTGALLLEGFAISKRARRIMNKYWALTGIVICTGVLLSVIFEKFLCELPNLVPAGLLVWVSLRILDSQFRFFFEKTFSQEERTEEEMA